MSSHRFWCGMYSRCGARRERHRLPVLHARRRGADVADDDVLFHLLLFDRNQPAGLQVDAAVRVDEPERRGRQDLAARAIHHVQEPVAVGAHRHLPRRSVHVQIGEHDLVHPIVVEQVVRTRLVEPARLAGHRRCARTCRRSTCCRRDADPDSTDRGWRCRSRSGRALRRTRSTPRPSRRRSASHRPARW